ncbi:glycosyltransferase [Coprococcus sp. AF21-14LB]|uniref:glycosyltransferase n=1 Tax=Coprococcus sp. AF21-14LB TaxID=2292231 RepID=UPI000E478F9D|nr:glycosyltransferase [Coprococcus sp. AF21-14LB]RGS75647.1 glycosyltransferase family 4 protein [Coprococcus sp. AF21-14LB]
MKIWVIGRSYPQAINNLQGSFEIEQAKMLAKYGNEVSYISCIFHPFKKIKKWGYCKWEEDNIQVFTYSQFWAHERMKLHLKKIKLKIWDKFLEQIEKDIGLPDIIHVHYPANITVAEGILKYKFKSVKIVCTEHWSQVLNNTIDCYEKKQLKLYVDNADKFLCVGSSLRNAIVNLTKTKREVYIVPNVVNEVFKPIEKIGDAFRFIVVGALVPIKQFDKVIQSFTVAFKSKEEVKLIIVGDGVEKKNLEKLVENLNMQKQIFFTGRLSHQDTANEIGQSDVLICYSKSETFGVPIIEAWACGLPVIATTEVAVVEQWDERLGIQVSAENMKELADKMQYIYKHKEEYNINYIQNFAQQNYSEKNIYEKLIHYYLK